MRSPFNALTGLLLLSISDLCQPLFVPEQLVTVLSFLYTNIPAVRKGTDSRVGLGFRLGQNADFQVVLELGPQYNTVPLGPNGGGSSAKRDVIYAERNPTNWLERWRFKQQQGELDENEDGHAPSYQQPAVDRDIIAHLKQLYKPKTKQEKETEYKIQKEEILKQYKQTKESSTTQNEQLNTTDIPDLVTFK